VFKIYDKTNKVHLSGVRAEQYIQGLSVPELEKELAEFNSWHGAVLQGAGSPVDCSTELEVLQNEINYRGATNG